jgi:hypothetical protein
MKIYKWVPVCDSMNTKKPIMKSGSDKENSQVRKVGGDSNSNWTTEDSNTCFSTVSDSQPTDFVPFSEDSNSQGSDSAAFPVPKRMKND